MTERANSQPGLPFQDTLEMVTNLTTGEKRFQKRKLRVKREPSARERAGALNSWLAATNFEMLFYQGAESHRQAESAKMLRRSFQNSEFDDALGGRDDVDSAFVNAFDKKRTDFRPIRDIDIVGVMKRQAYVIEKRLRVSGDWVQSYLQRTVDLMCLTRERSYRQTENLKDYARQLYLVA